MLLANTSVMVITFRLSIDEFMGSLWTRVHLLIAFLVKTYYNEAFLPFYRLF